MINRPAAGTLEIDASLVRSYDGRKLVELFINALKAKIDDYEGIDVITDLPANTEEETVLLEFVGSGKTFLIKWLEKFGLDLSESLEEKEDELVGYMETHSDDMTLFRVKYQDVYEYELQTVEGTIQYSYTKGEFEFVAADIKLEDLTYDNLPDHVFDEFVHVTPKYVEDVLCDSDAKYIVSKAYDANRKINEKYDYGEFVNMIVEEIVFGFSENYGLVEGEKLILSESGEAEIGDYSIGISLL